MSKTLRKIYAINILSKRLFLHFCLVHCDVKLKTFLASLLGLEAFGFPFDL